MALTKTQLDKVLEAIKRHFNSFTYEAIGERALTTAELDSLKSLGLARESVRNLVADPIAVGRLIALVPPSTRRSLSLDEVLKRAKEVLPQTAVERRAIEYAQEHAGTYITGIRDMTVRDATAATARSRTAALRAVRSGVSNAIATRQTRSELKTSLFDAIDNKTRDWQRIAHTEINNAIQNGIHGEILDEGGPDQMVYKRPSGDACQHCKRLFLKDDGTPRIFRISQLKETNVGKKATDWEPTIGSVHPWCACMLHVIPEGYEFAKIRVVKQPFEFDDVEYRAGQAVSEGVFAKLGPTEQSKIGFDSTLKYTGVSATPDVEKSFKVSHTSDDCFCEH